MKDTVEIVALLLGLVASAIWARIFLKVWRSGDFGTIRSGRHGRGPIIRGSISRTSNRYAYWFLIGLAALVLPVVWVLLLYELLF